MVTGRPSFRDGLRLTGQRNAYRLVVANHFQHGATHEELGPSWRCHLSLASYLGLEDGT